MLFTTSFRLSNSSRKPSIDKANISPFQLLKGNNVLTGSHSHYEAFAHQRLSSEQQSIMKRQRQHDTHLEISLMNSAYKQENKRVLPLSKCKGPH
eukprot:scaffold68665_cov17-Tisochrysis_lutea.AAC.2